MKTLLPAGLRIRLGFYNLVFPFVLIFMLPRLALRMMRRGQYRRKFGQRFGKFDETVRGRLLAKNWTWLHSISVGETLLALNLARKMKELEPGLQVVLSVTTSTGFALAEEATSDWLEAIYNPLDAPIFVRRTLNLVRPERLIFIEAVWPNLLTLAKARGATVSLIARLSPRSEKRFRKFRFLTGPVFRALDVICVQEEEDVARWKSLGARAAQLHVTGNIKFDQPATASPRVAEFRDFLTSLGIAEEAPILLAGSTFPGEEGILAETFVALRQKFNDLFLILVPRHVERTDQVVADVIAAGLSFALRTSPEPKRGVDCLIVNTTGELRDWYHLATVVFIGKSLTAIGGQNPVEAALAGRPVVFGPHMENFQAIVTRWLAHDAVIQVAGAASLEHEIAQLFASPERRGTMAAQARALAASHQGATERVTRLLLRN